MFAYKFLFSSCADLKDVMMSKTIDLIEKYNEKKENLIHGKKNNENIKSTPLDSPVTDREFVDREFVDREFVDKEFVDKDFISDEIFKMNSRLDPRKDSESELQHINNTTIMYICSVSNSNTLEHDSDIDVNFEYMKTKENLCSKQFPICKIIARLKELKYQMDNMLTDPIYNLDFVTRWRESPWLLDFDTSIEYLTNRYVLKELNIMINKNKIECEQINIYEINGIVYCEIICINKGFFWNNRYKISMWPYQRKLCMKTIRWYEK